MSKKRTENQSVLIVAAEPSSVLYAERILELYQKKESSFEASIHKEIHFFGVGSEKMEKLGFQRIGLSEEMSVVGFQEVLSRFFSIRRVFKRILKEAEKKKPKVALLIDYPDFNLRLAGRLKKMGIPILYYISPQVWAWRGHRIHEIKKKVDKMLVILPFEEKIYNHHKIPVEFVGHPLVDEMKDQHFDENYWFFKRSQFGLEKKDFVLGLMPGSRPAELDHHLKLHLNVAKKLKKDFPEIKITLLLSPNFKREEIKERLKNFDAPSFILLQDHPFEMIGLNDLLLTASGTATLMVGLMEKPLVIMYKTSFVSAFILKHLVKPMPGIIRCFGLPNLILKEKTVPELFQEKVSEKSLYLALKHFVDHPKKRKNINQKLKGIRKKLSGEYLRENQDKDQTKSSNSYQAVLKNILNYF